MFRKLLCATSLLLALTGAFAQTNDGWVFTDKSRSFLASDFFDDAERGPDRLRIVFWNVENFFDTLDHPAKVDEAFTPQGENKWNGWRFDRKLERVSKTLIATGGWEPPGIIGLCEIENRAILQYIADSGMLASIGYEIVHRESADRRGIDVGLLYRPDKFELEGHQMIRPSFPGDSERTTRDVLHVWGKLRNGQRLHVMVNHWPSRWSGMLNTEPNRIHMAGLVRNLSDSIVQTDPGAAIVITGDFNDEPENESMAEVLCGPGSPLTNLMEDIQYKGGSHYFAGSWGVLDHFVVSNALLSEQAPSEALPGAKVRYGRAQIMDFRFLLKANGLGTLVPHRTYQGPMYVGGFSDHLPIMIDLDL
jgi:predicted extracellular nuclease